MWVCDVDWEMSEGSWDPYAYSAIAYMDCPDGSQDYYGTPPCEPPIFTEESCDLLTGWFTQAKQYCLTAQHEYDQYYDWHYYMTL